MSEGQVKELKNLEKGAETIDKPMLILFGYTSL